jgi:hypothetical protein
VSYNIDHVEILGASMLTITGENLKAVRKLAARSFYSHGAETCWLNELPEADDIDDGALYPIEFEWHGEGSGHSWNEWGMKALTLTQGRLEAILTWEGGDSVTGLRVVDGVVTEPEVIKTLAPDAHASGASG